MVSATCPNCNILLVEATSASDANLGTAVNEAVKLGAKFVSNSYGGAESSSDTTYDSSYYNHPGVAITASAGDSGFGAEYPAASKYVTAVGGTALKTSSNSRGWTESVWNTSSTEGTGSGCSTVDAKPTWQTDTGCTKRMIADVSAVADPATGVSVYDSYGSDGTGWNTYGGTSASSPLIASVYALAGTPGSSDYPSQYPYNAAGTSALNDVTSGSNGSCSTSYFCTAKSGYDGPTGWGTPRASTPSPAEHTAPHRTTAPSGHGEPPEVRRTWGLLGGTERGTGHGSRPRPVFPRLDASSPVIRGRPTDPPSPNGPRRPAAPRSPCRDTLHPENIGTTTPPTGRQKRPRS